MEFDELLAPAKWQILEIIGKTPSSPIEIAEKIETSVAYVSQQLKILEAVNLVTKKKTGEFKKGKPRSLFSLSRDIIHLSLLTQGFPSKKLLESSEDKKIIARIWSYADGKLHKPFQKIFWKIEEFFDEIDEIYLDESKVKKKLVVVSKNKKLKSLVGNSKDFDDVFDLSFVTSVDYKKLDYSKIFVLYDPHFHLVKMEEKL